MASLKEKNLKRVGEEGGGIGRLVAINTRLLFRSTVSTLVPPHYYRLPLIEQITVKVLYQ